MNILLDEQYPVLAFIAACNGSSYNPTASQVELWRDNLKPTSAEYLTVERPEIGSFGALATPGGLSRIVDTIYQNMQGGMASLMAQAYGPNTYRKLVKRAETVVEHLVRLTWLVEVSGSGEEPGLKLTDLGRALLRDREREVSTDEDVSVVVLGREDPLAYPILIGQLSAAGPGLLVDPYLKLDALHTIVVNTRLTRLLVSGKPPNSSVVASMRAYLDSSSLARRVEVRASTGLHDRVLIADDGELVMTLGTSINGVGRTTTVMTPMTPKAREALQEEYAQLWEEAELIGPPVEVEAEAEAEGDQEAEGGYGEDDHAEDE